MENRTGGYYILSLKEGNFIIRLLELCLDFPQESKPSLLAIKECLDNGYKLNLRRMPKLSQKHKLALHKGRDKERLERSRIQNKSVGDKNV